MNHCVLLVIVLGMAVTDVELSGLLLSWAMLYNTLLACCDGGFDHHMT